MHCLACNKDDPSLSYLSNPGLNQTTSHIWTRNNPVTHLIKIMLSNAHNSVTRCKPDVSKRTCYLTENSYNTNRSVLYAVRFSDIEFPVLKINKKHLATIGICVPVHYVLYTYWGYTVYTMGHTNCHFISNNNCSVSWSIFIFFPVVTGMNATIIFRILSE